MSEAECPLTRNELGEAMFLLALLENEFGGTPSLGVADNGSFVVAATCPCNSCVEFRKIYPTEEKSTMLAAAKQYGDDRLCFLHTKEFKDSRGLVH